MHICTFYSFKGGVGRTLALVNVAAQLASEGRRVLLVDFDLEAPGLGSFELLRSDTDAPGIVDYVLHFLNKDSAPFIGDYVAQTRENKNIFVMKSGELKRDYAAKMADIDWIKLYEHQDGYLLFEDMKAQWQKEIEPDYVLIDSRTGYTDTVGICTRQLPDAVAILFYPNEQNLSGLKQIVANIRGEANTLRQKKIKLHFVMSNVPFLDDEDDVLIDITKAFRDELAINELLTIHRYESLQLLQQSVFSVERPNSRLAREYRHLTNRIIQGNLASREGALYYLETLRNRLEGKSSVSDKQSAIDETRTLLEIERNFEGDTEILVNLALLWLRGGNTVLSEDHGLDLASNALMDGLDSISQENQIALLDAFAILGGGYFAHHTALAALQQQSVPLPSVKRLLSLIHADHQITSLPAISNLHPAEQLELGVSLERQGNVQFSSSILDDLLGRDEIVSREIRRVAKSILARNSIAQGKHFEARRILSQNGRAITAMSLEDAFNYATATWLESDEFPRTLFHHVAEIAVAELKGAGPEAQLAFEASHEQPFEFSSDRQRDASRIDNDEGFMVSQSEEHLQLLLLIGRITNHEELTWDKLLIDLMLEEFAPTRFSLRFSYLRYRYVLFDQFISDTNEIRGIEFRDDSRAPFPVQQV